MKVSIKGPDLNLMVPALILAGRAFEFEVLFTKNPREMDVIPPTDLGERETYNKIDDILETALALVGSALIEHAKHRARETRAYERS